MTQLNFPIAGLGPVVTSPYGWRTHPTLKTRKFHNGADLSAPQGTPLIAPADGKVISTINNDVCGYGLVIQHDGIRTGYCHLSRVDVEQGQHVASGQRLGLTGGKRGTKGAGRSTGPHLHWIVYTQQGGEWKHADPMPYVSEGGSSWPSIAGMWDRAQAFWTDLWDTPSADPAEPSKSIKKPSMVAKASWQVGPGVPMSLRLVDAYGKPHGPGTIPAAKFSVQANNGVEWSSTGGELTAQSGHQYRVDVVSGRLRLTDLGT